MQGGRFLLVEIGGRKCSAVRPLLVKHTSRPRLEDWVGGGTPPFIVVAEPWEDPEADELKRQTEGRLRDGLPPEGLLGVAPPGRPSPAGENDLADGSRMVGQSDRVRSLKTYIARVAASDSTVLITGETGTGKELVAELIHRNSARRDKPFVCVNCAAIPEGLVEGELFGYERGAFTGAVGSSNGSLRDADGGTVLLDEIGDLSTSAQAKILRALESRRVRRLGGRRELPLNIRIVAATNQNLERLMAENQFRADLYFRLNVARIHLPPLRERKDDIAALSRDQIERLNDRFGRRIEGFAEETLACLLRYDWPGNVRELKNLLEAAFITCTSNRISPADLPEWFRGRQDGTANAADDERQRLVSALSATQWNKSKAAQQLHWSRMTLYRKLAKYGIAGSHG